MNNKLDLDNHANQLNPNNDAYWQSRIGDDDPDDEAGCGSGPSNWPPRYLTESEIEVHRLEQLQRERDRLAKAEEKAHTERLHLEEQLRSYLREWRYIRSTMASYVIRHRKRLAGSELRRTYFPSIVAFDDEVDQMLGAARCVEARISSLLHKLRPHSPETAHIQTAYDHATPTRRVYEQALEEGETDNET
ncbi:hypothetical protein [uncultured Salinisphaera sp.]|uniref:hypothetical protein n=1 Tax=uncultured Salinisphaera sp. TaxID=359372 RepID=UPI0032B23F3F|tara:strand:- start:546 stop:1118 length:573 start_codon:yes stop_codon:yes gene_type:complete